MPIISSEVVDGPNIQADESRRGTIVFTLDDGRIIRRTVRAPDATVWANLLINLPAEVEEKVQIDDAEDASEIDSEITAVNQATIKQVALAFLRKAFGLTDPYQAYLKFDRFNNYRLSQGWTVVQVVSGLTEAGLTQDEWDFTLARYQYLSEAGRVTAMVAYQAVLDGDVWSNG